MKRKCRYGKGGWWWASRGIESNWHILLFAFCLLPIYFSCREKAGKPVTDSQPQAAIYYCPMHPEVQQDHPGRCPIEECNGMELVLKTSDTLLENTLKPVNASVLASITTAKPVFKKMFLNVAASGFIDYDDRGKNNISSLVSGRIEKLFVRSNYQPVHMGEKVFEIYSPELVTAQENLIYILNNSPEEKSLIEAAAQKLKLLGFSDKMIEQLMTAKKVIRAIPVYSKFKGHVRESNVVKPASGMKNPMVAQDANYESEKILSVKEGKYVMMGETVFNVVNGNELAVVLSVKSSDIPKVYESQEAEIQIEGGTTFSGKIDFIEPQLRQGAKTITAKIYFDNSKHNFKIGSLVRAKFKGREFEALWIPLSALVDLGIEKIVWLKKDGNFSAKKVETGAVSDGMIEIADGLTEEDEIALEAHYLTDSEGFVKENEKENE